MERIAYLGLGTMGSGMAANLIRAGYPVTVWNRTAEKCEPLVALGATEAATPAEAVADVNLIMVCLSDDEAVYNVLLGEDGILAGVHSGQIAVDMSTVHPDTSRRKDVNLISRLAEQLQSPIPETAVVRETLKAAVNQGWGDENASALIKALERQADTIVEG